ncbi:MAG: hypothetical protein A2007_01075 [Verrucomicrobia bacterium GWC2_42_7]|nr:MAG: hypothetical protein A2007_01075 [Verrucomicrobia bacterium GWC2_42_7]
MPTYSYLCQHCAKEIEIFHSIIAEPVKVCPNCNQESLIKQIGNGALVSFKGSGFYETDYKRQPSKEK